MSGIGVVWVIVTGIVGVGEMGIGVGCDYLGFVCACNIPMYPPLSKLRMFNLY